MDWFSLAEECSIFKLLKNLNITFTVGPDLNITNSLKPGYGFLNNKIKYILMKAIFKAVFTFSFGL